MALPVGELKVIRFTSPQMSYEKSNDEASLRIKDASKYNVHNLVKTAINIAYS